MYFRKQCLSPIRPVMMVASNISLIINVLPARLPQDKQSVLDYSEVNLGVVNPAVAQMRVKFDFARGWSGSSRGKVCYPRLPCVVSYAFNITSILYILYINLVYRIVLYCTPCTLLLISTS